MGCRYTVVVSHILAQHEVLLSTPAGSMYTGLSSWCNIAYICHSLVLTERIVNCPGIGNFSNEKPWSTLLRPVPPPQCNSNVKFLLLTRMNLDNPVLISWKDSSIEESHYDSSKWTVFLNHGWLSKPETFIAIAQRYLSCVDANIFIVDYRDVAANKNYFQAVSNIRVVAAQIAQFVEFLIEEKGACKCMFHLVGMSLGAHLAAYVCKRVRGLQRLTADFNFIINDGKKQPGCSGISSNGCSHSRALSLYLYSICSNNCTFVGFDSRNNKKGERDCVPMSLETMYYRNTGKYYVRTSANAPYCLRKNDCIPF
ncbi:hypothetical protein C0J52_09838 [Blattella germanica]|nr:hypothetical protein C0J52_09838 [Blattella germanica]